MSEAIRQEVQLYLAAKQIIGFNYKAAGYSSAEAMYEDFSKGEDQQIIGMLNFIPLRV